MSENQTAHTCPYCQARAIETVATLPLVRGDGLGARFSARTIAGCRPCVRRQLLFETLRSSLDGWTSPAAALANPVLITYGLARAGVVRKDPERVRRMLKAAGISDPEEERKPVRIAYGLAAALIAADGTVNRDEVDAALDIGKTLFPDFDEADFLEAVAAGRDLPTPAELAKLLRQAVNAETRESVYRYLVAIAAADREVAVEERALLGAIAGNLGLEGPGHGLDRSV